MFRRLSTRLLTYTCVRRTPTIESSVWQFKYPLASNCGGFLHVRYKYVTSGVQGRRNSKTAPKKSTEDEEDYDDFENDGYSDKRVSIKDRYEVLDTL